MVPAVRRLTHRDCFSVVCLSDGPSLCLSQSPVCLSVCLSVHLTSSIGCFTRWHVFLGTHLFPIYILYKLIWNLCKCKLIFHDVSVSPDRTFDQSLTSWRTKNWSDFGIDLASFKCRFIRYFECWKSDLCCHATLFTCVHLFTIFLLGIQYSLC